MKKKTWIIISIVAVVLVLGFVGIRILKNGSKFEELDTSDAALTVTQEGDTIVFDPDNTLVVQGDVEISGFNFAYQFEGTYSVIDGKLTIDQEYPTIAVSSAFGNFDVAGHITADLKDGYLIIQIDGSNDTTTFRLASFLIGKSQADQLGIVGVTADDIANDAAATRERSSSDNTMEKQHEYSIPL